MELDTRFAKFIDNASSEYLWNTIVDAWTTIFKGFPNIITHDQGSYFVSDYFQTCCAELGIISKPTPTESHNSLSLCERYHSIIRRVFLKLKSQHKNLPKEIILSTSVHAVNTTARPIGLVPTLLMFGTLPRLPLTGMNSIPLSQKERFAAMKLAREEMMTITA